MSEVGALIIKLQAETAQFREDMGKVKSDLDNLKPAAEGAGDSMRRSMTDSRESVMLLGEEIGVHMPRALSMYISKLGGVAAVMEVAFPIIGIVAVIGIIGKLIERQKELQEKTQKFADDQTRLGTAGATAMNVWKEKIEDAEIRIDELRGNHLAALALQLDKLDRQTMKDLVQQFDTIDKAAQVAFADIKTSWYQFGEGSEGAKKALDEFSIKYAALMVDPKNKGQAQDLLAGTLNSAEKYLAIQEKLRNSHGILVEEAVAYARENGKSVDATENAYKAQQELVNVLKEKVALTQEAAKAEHIEGAAMSLEEEDKEAIRLRRDHGELRKARQEAAKEAEKENEEMSDGLRSVDKMMADSYQKQLDQNKSLAEAADNLAAAKVKAAAAGEKSNVTNAASQGFISKQAEANALHAIDVKELEDYEKVQKDKLGALVSSLSQAKAAEEAAKGTDRQEETQEAAVKAQLALNKAQADFINGQQSLTDKVNQSRSAAANLQSSWTSYFARMKSETTELSTTIRTTLQGSMNQLVSGFSESIGKTIVEGKSLGKEMKHVADQILESMISMLVKWGIQWVISHTLMRGVDAASNATQLAQATATTAALKVLAGSVAGANAVASFAAAPWPIDMGAPAFGASMMATAMSFEVGGKIPGDGAVPIIGHGGETVVTRALTNRVEAAESRGSKGGMHSHVHIHASAMDSEGMDRVLTKHSSTINKHVTHQLRKMNR